MTEAITEVAASTPAQPTRPRLITHALREPWTASLAAAVVAIAGLVVVLLSGRWLPARPATARADTGNHGLQMLAATRLPTLRRPVAVFFLVVASVRTLIAFLPTTALVFGVAVAYTSQPTAVALLLVMLASGLLPLRRLNRTRPTGPDVNARLRPGRLAAAPDGPNPALAG
jgi:hypothetical protein